MRRREVAARSASATAIATPETAEGSADAATSQLSSAPREEDKALSVR